MENKVSPAPPGAFVELSTDYIDEGLFKDALDETIRKGLSDLKDYEKATGDLSGQLVVTTKLKIGRMDGSDSMYTVEYAMDSKLPIRSKSSLVKEMGGRLLCQPTGSSEHDPDQQVFFDIRGNPIVKDESVAGKITKTA